MKKIKKRLDFILKLCIMILSVGLSSNGRTADSDSVSLGSSPGSPAKSCKSSEMTTFSFISKCLLQLGTEILENA